MANEFETLHDRVEACRRHLTAVEMNSDVRGELLQLLTDLDERLANRTAQSKTTAATIRTEQQAVPSPIERLRDLERSVEVEHPVLCGLVGNVADALSRMGV